MNEFEQHFKRINEKLQQILKHYTLLQKENGKLKNELAAVKATLKEKEEHLELLVLRSEVLKASKGLMTEEERKIFEHTINQHLKEIDKCISLLNE